MLEILTGSPLNSVQDFGRPLAMTLGVAHGGAMDPHALACGNLLLGNARDAAGIEIAFYPFRVRFSEDTAFAVTGAHAPARLDDWALPTDWAMIARAGQSLTIERPTHGNYTYLSMQGGIDVPSVLGSRSTDAKAGFGGFEGRGLMRGDRLARRAEPSRRTLPPHGAGLARSSLPDTQGTTTLRVIPAAEYACFTDQARALLEETAWGVSTQANRTGFRLEGEAPLILGEPLSLLSHGIVPGTIQVPTAGQPIVQMADANTCGGYPKIATVLECDLRLLAQTRVGERVRFVPVGRDEGLGELRCAASAFEAMAERLGNLRFS